MEAEERESAGDALSCLARKRASLGMASLPEIRYTQPSPLYASPLEVGPACRARARRQAAALQEMGLTIFRRRSLAECLPGRWWRSHSSKPANRAAGAQARA